MMGKKHRLLLDTIQRLLRREAYTNIKRILQKTHPADVALLLTQFAEERRKVLFDLIESVEDRSLVLSEMPHEEAAGFLAMQPIETVLELLHLMESDDAADIIGSLPEELQKEVLRRMSREESDDVGDLLKYGEDTAGGIMTPDFIALHENMTADKAIESLRENREVDMAFYIYVVNDHSQLVGVLSLRKLVLVAPGRILNEIMEPNVVSVRSDTDQEEVARLVARYNLLAVPVVDENNVLIGIVTVDDIIDVIKEEATEDILKMAGAGDELIPAVSASVTRSTRTRFPWLLVSFVGELIGVAVISPFITQLQTHHYMALFMPIIMAMGGNVGTQSATVVVRGLAVGYIDPKKIFSVFWREVQVALLLGLGYGLAVGLASLLFSDANVVLGLSVAISMALAMLIAVTVGTLLPLLMARLHIDPAVSTGPFVTSAVDVLGLLVYFAVSSVLLSLL